MSRVLSVLGRVTSSFDFLMGMTMLSAVMLGFVLGLVYAGRL